MATTSADVFGLSDTSYLSRWRTETSRARLLQGLRSAAQMLDLAQRAYREGEPDGAALWRFYRREVLSICDALAELHGCAIAPPPFALDEPPVA